MAKKSHEIGGHSDPKHHTPEQVNPPMELDAMSPPDAPHNAAAIAYNRKHGYQDNGKTG